MEVILLQRYLVNNFEVANGAHYSGKLLRTVEIDLYLCARYHRLLCFDTLFSIAWQMLVTCKCSSIKTI